MIYIYPPPLPPHQNIMNTPIEGNLNIYKPVYFF